MPRTARLVTPGYPHYVVQHARASDPLFRAAGDFQRYLNLVCAKAQRYRLGLLGFCLLPYRVEWVVVPETAESLALAIGRAHSEYALRVHRHLWRDRFASQVLDHTLGWHAVLYVERSPVRAGLITTAGDYPWSSAAAHLGRPARVNLDLERWHGRFDAEMWESVLNAGLGETGLAQRLQARPPRTAVRRPAAAARA